jgi:hypothetical protein
VNENDATHFGEAVQMNLGGRSVFWSGLIPRMRGLGAGALAGGYREVFKRQRL